MENVYKFSSTGDNNNNYYYGSLQQNYNSQNSNYQWHQVYQDNSTFYQQLSRKEENTRAGLNVNIEKEKIVEIGKSENRSQMQHTAEFPYYRYQETKNVVNNIEPTKSYDYIDKAL